VNAEINGRMHCYRGANGATLAADVGGSPSAPAVILLHGGGQTRHSWGAAMRELVIHHYHVINFDARGHGASDWAPDGDYSLNAFAADLEAIVNTLDTRPALVGASMGGATSLFLAGTRSEALLSALVLVDIVPQIDRAGAARIHEFMRSGCNGFSSLEHAAAAIAQYNPHRPKPPTNRGLLKNLRLHEDGRFYWHWDPRFLETQERAEPPLLGNKLVRAAQGVQIPTLLIRGLQSDVVTEAGVEDFRGHLPQLEVYDVGGAGHMVAGDKNDAFNQGALTFLRRRFPPDKPAQKRGGAG
jgi:pimeloyl-ACP methyl ester carboxylesterase